jgi:hypothetical protein
MDFLFSMTYGFPFIATSLHKSLAFKETAIVAISILTWQFLAIVAI